MKRISLLLIIALLLSTLVACGSGDAPSEVSVKKVITVDDVVNCYDSNVYYIQAYENELIEEVKSKLVLEGDILDVIHIVNNQTAPPDLEWTYVYRFSSETDAAWFFENRSEFVKTVNNGRCVRFGNIVVYGSSSVIDSLKSVLAD